MEITGNIVYLQKLIDIAKQTDEEGEHEIYFTELNDDLRFITQQIDFVYIGSLAETKIEVVLEKLYNHRLEILKKIIMTPMSFLSSYTFKV